MHLSGLTQRMMEHNRRQTTARKLADSAPERWTMEKMRDKRNRGLTLALVCVLLSLCAANGATNDNRGFRVDGTQATAQQQKDTADFVLRLAYPCDWTWFEIDKPWSWQFVEEKELDRMMPHMRRIPYAEATRNLDNKLMVRYEYDLCGLTNTIMQSKVPKERCVVVVHPGFDDEQSADRKQAGDFKDLLLSLGFKQVTFQRALSLTGDWPLDPFKGTNTEVQQQGRGYSPPAARSAQPAP